MKTGLANILYVIFLNFPCVIACLLCCLLSRFFFLLVLWLGICVEGGCRQNYCLTRPSPLPLSIFFPTHNSFFNTSDRYLKSARA